MLTSNGFAVEARMHSDGGLLLGRKIKGRSERELRDLGLLVVKEPT